MEKLKRYLYLYETLVLQLGNIVLPFLAFLLLSSKEVTFTIDLQIFLVWLSIFAIYMLCIGVLSFLFTDILICAVLARISNDVVYVSIIYMSRIKESLR